MTRHPLVLAAPLLLAGAVVALSFAAATPVDRPDAEPPVITPGGPLADAKPVPPPSDAIVLFDGSSLDAWQTTDNKPAAWTLADGAMTIAPGSGSIITKQKFSDAQIHVEFATPAQPHGESQERGNSGVYLQGRYEVQVLDSFQNQTYPDGQCGAIYKQHAPLVNASLPPGRWQTYDIIFRAARFDDAGNKTANATITVLHNGVLIQDHAEVSGITGSAPFKESAAPGPIYLQDHGNPGRFRNIWIRPL